MALLHGCRVVRPFSLFIFQTLFPPYYPFPATCRAYGALKHPYALISLSRSSAQRGIGTGVDINLPMFRFSPRVSIGIGLPQTYTVARLTGLMTPNVPSHNMESQSRWRVDRSIVQSLASNLLSQFELLRCSSRISGPPRISTLLWQKRPFSRRSVLLFGPSFELNYHGCPPAYFCSSSYCW